MEAAPANPHALNRAKEGQAFSPAQAQRGITLAEACQEGRLKVVENILKFSTLVNVNAKDESEFTPLVHACKGGHVDIVSMLLSKGANPDLVDIGKQTALHHVCVAGRLDCLFQLIGAGANVNARDGMLQTALHIACMIGAGDVVAVLLKADADVDAVDNDLNTPLHRACFGGSDDCAEKLVAASAALNAQNFKGYAPMHFACRACNVRATAAGGERCVDLLFAAGASYDVADTAGSTPSELLGSLDQRYRYLQKFVDREVGSIAGGPEDEPEWSESAGRGAQLEGAEEIDATLAAQEEALQALREELRLQVDEWRAAQARAEAAVAGVRAGTQTSLGLLAARCDRTEEQLQRLDPGKRFQGMLRAHKAELFQEMQEMVAAAQAEGERGEF